MARMDQPLHPESLTWTALLGKWIEFAKASVALPADAEGASWRASVAPVINLQAVTFALAELGELEPADRPLALDRAEVMIDDNQRTLATTWGDDPPESLVEIILDARSALRLARTAASGPVAPGADDRRAGTDE